MADIDRLQTYLLNVYGVSEKQIFLNVLLQMNH